MSILNALSGNRLKRLVSLPAACVAFLILTACGGNNNTSTATTSKLKNRAFISNSFGGVLQIVDSQNDTTATTASGYNSQGQIVQGSPIVITVVPSITFQVESPDHTTTMVYDPKDHALYFVTNASESTAGAVALSSAATSALFSPDNTKVYAAEPNLPVSGQRNGGVEVITRADAKVTATYDVPSAKSIAISPNGQFLLVFADTSDSVFLIDLNAATPAPVEIMGFARPVNAFFTSDGATAYVLNCGPECGSSGPASVAALNIGTQMITATVPVGGASVGLLNGTTLYVAGSPVPPGTTSTYDAVDVAAMTRLTANSVAIGDGFHTTMALAHNNKLYIGANSCSNTATGCLSVVDVSNNTADPALPPRGAITSLLAVPNRNVVYAIEGGLIHIYDSTTDQLQGKQLTFTGALYGIVQADQ